MDGQSRWHSSERQLCWYDFKRKPTFCAMRRGVRFNLPSSVVLSYFSKDFCLHFITECYWVWYQSMMFLYSQFHVNKRDTTHNRQQQAWPGTQAVQRLSSVRLLLFFSLLFHSDISHYRPKISHKGWPAYEQIAKTYSVLNCQNSGVSECPVAALSGANL